MQTIERLESEVRGYVRSFPTVFSTAKGNRQTDENAREYIDFFGGAGALNYGHNDEAMKKALIDYIESDGVTHGLDTATAAKQRFLEAFDEIVMKPRDMNYKLQFPGPTGTNAVEAALKLARKVTGRSQIMHFTHGFHGMTLGAMTVTANAAIRESAGVDIADSTVVPYSDFYDDPQQSIAYIERMLTDPFSGMDKPAAMIVEAVQGEGGIHVADYDWLKEIERLCRDHDILLILDEIQAGVGRTGPFFAFEPSGIKPDMITMAKSVSGYGLPMSLVLIRPEIDEWDAGEHTGTFRGNNHAFVTAVAALETYWRDDTLHQETLRKGEHARERMRSMIDRVDGFNATIRGQGLFIGMDCERPELGNEISAACFERGLILETTGEDDRVVKVMPPLITPDADLDAGLDILEDAVKYVGRQHGLAGTAA
ncbi:diaminobutyrate--2-oxoglutarate transaminase [Salinisphaera sp. USBA-960]|uniref:diaminobutyrate--2-oxoglutarate transaminase n=1 Tax=Salinisphaera orenii TaxID=856731 RepID=UPI000DBE783D|nr:diaminobutyrate--2-oxoglutarate transaminase [Salifodinibacter halophilus]NNC25522.1 diaminobutyrate--2-oxoglutarate transaminase [Salifodinibacter halophilus]